MRTGSGSNDRGAFVGQIRLMGKEKCGITGRSGSFTIVWATFYF